MNSGYGSTAIKREGIRREFEILQKIIRYLESLGYKVTYRKATLEENINKKIDYFLFFDKSKIFLNKFSEISIDIKSSNSYTIIENITGENALEKSEAMYIVTNTLRDLDEIAWVDVKKLKECVEKNPPILKDSKEPGNTSKYFWLNSYIEENKAEFFGNFVKVFYHED